MNDAADILLTGCYTTSSRKTEPIELREGIPMPVEIMLAKCQDGALRPVSSVDQDEVAKLKIGQGLRVQATQVKQRSLQWHRLYFGGLLGLAYEYWNPAGGLVSASEIATLEKFAAWLDSKSSNTGAIQHASEAFLLELTQRRAEKIEAPIKSIAGLHRWIKEEAGYYDLIVTPRGLVRQVRSLNFNSMDGDEFAEFYKKAFSVVWRFILSRTFSSEAEAQNAVDQLVSMG